MQSVNLNGFESSQIDFGLKCLKIAAEKGEGNTCISPYSLVTAASMLRLGATGATDAELANLFDQSQGASQVADDFAKAEPTLEDLKVKGKLLVANAIWSAHPLNPTFASEAAAKFGARAARTTFPEPGVDLINKWVDENTKGRIKKIFENLDPDTESVLANAVWFKDAWVKSFDPKDTRPSSFHIRENVLVDVPTLVGHEMDYRYGAAPGLRYFELKMKSATLLIGIPAAEPADGLENPAWRSLLRGEASLEQTRNAVVLPKVEFETSVNLLDVLVRMGMKVANTRSADFSKMTKEKVFITQAAHKTFLKWDEEGAEAAAVTAFATGRGGPPPGMMVVNKPFLFAIKADRTLLFIGVVNDPRAK